MPFLFTNKTLPLNNLKTRTDMNVKIPVFLICAETIVYLLLYNFHDYTFKCHRLQKTAQKKNSKKSNAH